MTLTKDNYFSLEANMAYMSVSQVKAFMACGEAAKRVAAIGGIEMTDGEEALRRAAERLRRREQGEPFGDGWCEAKRRLPAVEDELDQIFEVLAEVRA